MEIVSTSGGELWRRVLPPGSRLLATVPGSLDQALEALDKDHDYLLKGGVFTADVIDVWLEYKPEREIDALRIRPHPYEFYLYLDI